ncbi:MAG: hypothetical protein Q7T50_01270, partial [Candidatus Magasanikbacteria bacterium]|nr:hypothetical protein [Candidatus Magasanikbacteria bacterium]
YYKYEPGIVGNTLGICTAIADCTVWIGALLEAPQDPNKPVWRCTDSSDFGAGMQGCQEVSAGASFNTAVN